ncbi:hypothetical protein, partial [Winogradskyella sp.]
PVSGGISQNIGIFLTDYLYTQANNQATQKIIFNASETDHRYHNLTGNSPFNSFDLNFVWYDFKSVKHQIYLHERQSEADIKILFLSNE